VGLSVGMFGLPNVGKSTLFNAMTGAGALVANYPFATIEPNTGIVEVPDERLEALSRLFKPPKTIPATVTFVDIAGLVKGASEGEGLGNQFLAQIRECDAIAMVVRCFEDPNVTHVSGRLDPATDIGTVDYELMIADLETVRRRKDRTAKLARQQKDAQVELAILERIEAALDDAIPARRLGLTEEERLRVKELSLLTLKPFMYVANVAETDAARTDGPGLDAVAAVAASEGAHWLPISARIESELQDIDAADRIEFLASLGLEESGLGRLARAAYEVLGLITFLTAGGQALLHDHEVTYSVVASQQDPVVGGTLMQSYHAISEALLAGLATLGIRGEGAPCEPRPASGLTPICFASASAEEVLVGGRKLIASAQWRSRGAFLQHGSLLLQDRQGDLPGLMRDSRAREAKPVSISLDQLVPEVPPPTKLLELLASGFEAALGIPLREARPPASPGIPQTAPPSTPPH